MSESRQQRRARERAEQKAASRPGPNQPSPPAEQIVPKKPRVIGTELRRNVDDSPPEPGEPPEWVDWSCEYGLRDESVGIDDSGNPNLEDVINGVLDYARQWSTATTSPSNGPSTATHPTAERWKTPSLPSVSSCRPGSRTDRERADSASNAWEQAGAARIGHSTVSRRWPYRARAASAVTPSAAPTWAQLAPERRSARTAQAIKSSTRPENRATAVIGQCTESGAVSMPAMNFRRDDDSVNIRGWPLRSERSAPFSRNRLEANICRVRRRSGRDVRLDDLPARSAYCVATGHRHDPRSVKRALMPHSARFGTSTAGCQA